MFESTSLRLHHVKAIKTCHVTLVATRTHSHIYLFFDWLRNCQILRLESAVWSWLVVSQSYRQTFSQSVIQIDIQSVNHTYRHTVSHTDRHSVSQSYRQTYSQSVSWIIIHTFHRHTKLAETFLCLIYHKANQAQRGVVVQHTKSYC